MTPLSRDENPEEETLPTLEAEELTALNKKDIQVEITVQEEKLAQMKPNMAAIAEYRKKVCIPTSPSTVRFMIITTIILSQYCSLI